MIKYILGLTSALQRGFKDHSWHFFVFEPVQEA